MTNEDMLARHQALYRAALDALPDPLEGVDLSDPAWRADPALVARRDERYNRAENLATARLKEFVTTNFGPERWREFRDWAYTQKKRRRAGLANKRQAA